MANNISLPGFSSSLLAGYYQSKLSLTATPAPSSHTSASAAKTATANDAPPWENTNQPAQSAHDAQVLSTTNFLDLSKVPVSTGSSEDAQTEQDNQKLFALYQAVNQLAYLAGMGRRDGMTTGQLAGLNTRFQTGLAQVQSFIASAKFNNITLQAGKPSSSVTSTVAMPFAPFDYTGSTIVTNANLQNALAGVSASDSFTVSIKEAGVTSDVKIDLSQVQGTLTLDNIVGYANQQLAAQGFATRLQRVITKGTVDDPKNASYGIAIKNAPSETVTLSADGATPALYVAGVTGTATSTADKAADNQGRLVKLSNLNGAPGSVFSQTVNPDTGTTTAKATVVDGNGNVYVVGNATGDFGTELNQGTQDVYLTKYDSAGNLQWTKLLGSAGTAAGYGLALNPAGGVVVAGSTTADLVPGAVADGNTDSFIAKYDGDGNRVWVKQVQTLATNQANAISVDASGNIYFGGQVNGLIGGGQTRSGGADAYVTKLDANGKLLYQKQFGTAGDDSVAATALAGDGGLVVASVQNGHAIVAKYAGGDATGAPLWQIDAGDLAGGAIGGLAVSGNQIYLSGTTTNGNLNAGGAAATANASSGGSDAFVFNIADQGTSASAGFVSYVGTSASDKGGAVQVGPDGTVYLTGTTTGTFAGQTRSVDKANNMFVAAMASDGAINWTRQYGGADGQSTGAGLAIDAAGSSVLDALGLPRGQVHITQSTDLASQTTLRPGDSFSIQLQGNAARTAKITIDQGETLQTLIAKINVQLLNNGKASLAYGSGGRGLKIELKTGVTATLVAGPKDSDALARLGIAAGTLTSSDPKAKTTDNTKVFGLGLTGKLDISTATGAGATRAQLLNVLTEIRTAYRVSNTPPTTTTTPAATGPVPAYLQSQLSNYQLALKAFGSSTSLLTSG